jgi:AraC family transcriptional regulator
VRVQHEDDAGRGIHLMRSYSTLRSGPLRAEAPGRDRIADCLQLIQDQLGDELTLARLAATAGLSTYHFARVFKRATGETP